MGVSGVRKQTKVVQGNNNNFSCKSLGKKALSQMKEGARANVRVISRWGDKKLRQDDRYNNQ